jgi:hypothetical protein
VSGLLGVGAREHKHNRRKFPNRDVVLSSILAQLILFRHRLQVYVVVVAAECQIREA